MQKQPKYRFYATLLNAYEWYKESENDDAFQQFIDKINRAPFVSEAADRGTAFNQLVDTIIGGEVVLASEPKLSHNGFDFPTGVTLECAEYVMYGIAQIREMGLIETSIGIIEVYGEIDYILPGMEQVDLKTTKDYEMGKYIATWQHIVYPYCYYLKTGCEPIFTYLATDFKTVVKEQYQYNHERDSDKLKQVCIELAQFAEEYRHLITDLKIFNLHDPNTPKVERVIIPKEYPKKERAQKEVSAPIYTPPIIDHTKPML